MWLTFGLLSSFLWSLVNLFDKFAVQAIIKRPAQGLFVSAVLAAFGAGVTAPTVQWREEQTLIYAAAALAGMLLQASQFCYFQALTQKEVGHVTALGSTYPLVVAIISVFFGRELNSAQWTGIILIVFMLICFRWQRGEKSDWRQLLTISGYVLGLAASCLVLDQIRERATFWETVPSYCLGLVFGGLLPLISKKERAMLKEALPRIRRYGLQLAGVELVNVVAVLCEVYAISIGNAALVNAAASTEPVFVLIFSHVLSKIAVSRPYFETVKNLRSKITIVIMIVIGLVLISWK